MTTLRDRLRENENLRERCGMNESGRELRELSEVRPTQAKALKALVEDTAFSINKTLQENLKALAIADESIQVVGIKTLYNYLETFRVQLQGILEEIGTKQQTKTEEI